MGALGEQGEELRLTLRLRQWRAGVQGWFKVAAAK
jgi:hypothetical protein